MISTLPLILMRWVYSFFFGFYSITLTSSPIEQSCITAGVGSQRSVLPGALFRCCFTLTDPGLRRSRMCVIPSGVDYSSVISCAQKSTHKSLSTAFIKDSNCQIRAHLSPATVFARDPLLVCLSRTLFDYSQRLSSRRGTRVGPLEK